jgi:hypothetical protein
MGILWNGDVTFCCDDYNGELVVGNVKEKSLLEIYEGKEFKKIRYEMERGILSRKRCQNCQGIVVDSKGKILRNYYKKYLLYRIIGHFKVHGLKKSIKKIWGEIKLSFYMSKRWKTKL